MTRRQHAEQGVLPIFDTFVFLDWFGTLSTARFWESITMNERHPLSSRLRRALEDLFICRKELVNAWMKGEVPESEVIESLGLRLPRGYREDYLLRQLLRDCRNARIDPEMLSLVREFRSCAFIAVASDNMDCFYRATPAVISGELSLDEILVSSQIGCLKAESPERFFGPTLDRYGMTPKDAVLIDDCRDTCEKFRAWGGHAFHFTDAMTLASDLRRTAPARIRMLV